MRALLTTGDIAERCGLTRQQVWNLIKSGELQPEPLNFPGKHYRFRDAPELRAWCAAKAKQRAGLGRVPDKELAELFQAIPRVPKSVKFYARRLVMAENLSFEAWLDVGRFLQALNRVQKHLPRLRDKRNNLA